ncbi:MAG: hypothetical protein ACN6OU_07435 [Stenotrophomonas acidaminiphila]
MEAHPVPEEVNTHKAVIKHYQPRIDNQTDRKSKKEIHQGHYRPVIRPGLIIQNPHHQECKNNKSNIAPDDQPPHRTRVTRNHTPANRAKLSKRPGAPRCETNDKDAAHYRQPRHVDVHTLHFPHCAAVKQPTFW